MQWAAKVLKKRDKTLLPNKENELYKRIVRELELLSNKPKSTSAKLNTLLERKN